MKLLLLVAVTLAGQLYFAQAECENEAPAFDCAGKGQPHFFRKTDSKCDFACLEGEKKLSCEDVHVFQQDLDNVRLPCFRQMFDCGVPGAETAVKLGGDKCRFACLVDGQPLYCPQVYPPKKV